MLSLFAITVMPAGFPWLLGAVVITAVLASLGIVDPIGQDAPDQTVDLGIIRLTGDGEEKLKLLPRVKILMNPLNPRGEASLRRGNVEFDRLYVSMQTSGYLPNKRLVVLDLGNGSYILIEGHRRYVVSGLLGFDMLPCVVLPPGSISQAEQLRMVLDHGTTSSLNSVEEFDAFKKCVRAGYTRELTCTVLGWTIKDKKTGKDKPNGNKYQQMLEYSMLPPAVQAEWEAYESFGKGATVVRSGQAEPIGYEPNGANMKALVQAMRKDTKELKHYGMPQEGPTFQARYDELRAGKELTKTKIDMGAIARFADQENGRPFLREMWRIVSNQASDYTLDQVHDALHYFHDAVLGVMDHVKPESEPQIVENLRKTYYSKMTAKPETLVPVAESEAPAPEPETLVPVAESEAPAPEPETLVPVAESEAPAPAPETEALAPAPETEALAPVSGKRYPQLVGSRR